MEKLHSVLRVAANILNKQSLTADKGWSSSLGFGRGANKFSPLKQTINTKHKQVPRTYEIKNVLISKNVFFN